MANAPASMTSEQRKDRLVTDLPLWADCPFQYSKKIFEVRRGRFENDEPEMIVIWHPRARKHIDVSAPITADNFKKAKRFLLRFC